MKDISLQIFAFVGKSRKENKFPSSKKIEGIQVTMEDTWNLFIEDNQCAFTDNLDPWNGFVCGEDLDFSGKNTLEVIEMMVEDVLVSSESGIGAVDLKLTPLDIEVLAESLLMSYNKGIETMGRVNEYGIDERITKGIMKKAERFAALRDRILKQTKSSHK